jgi:SPX domain protein involved in polyphosphate accumulation
LVAATDRPSRALARALGIGVSHHHRRAFTPNHPTTSIPLSLSFSLPFSLLVACRKEIEGSNLAIRLVFTRSAAIMRFGKTLQSSVYPPWRDHYIDYNKLKQLLREVGDSDETYSDASGGGGGGGEQPAEWTDADESRFVDELINVQLEKVHKFQLDMNSALNERTARCEQRLEKYVADGPDGRDKKVLEETLKELDKIAGDVNELERFSRINFTGFLKAAKKHDRRSRGAGRKDQKGKGKRVVDPKVKPLLQVRLSHLEFNKEDYSPLLYRYVGFFFFFLCWSPWGAVE